MKEERGKSVITEKCVDDKITSCMFKQKGNTS